MSVTNLGDFFINSIVINVIFLVIAAQFNVSMANVRLVDVFGLSLRARLNDLLVRHAAAVLW